MELLGDMGHVESRSVHLETVLQLVQDRCMVCAKRTIGSELFWTLSMVLLGDEAQVVTHFGLFGGSANLDARQVKGFAKRTIGSETDLDTPDGTPR